MVPLLIILAGCRHGIQQCILLNVQAKYNALDLLGKAFIPVLAWETVGLKYLADSWEESSTVLKRFVFHLG